MAKRVLISGANGFIASHIVRLLLNGGHDVVGTVRDPEDAAKSRHLTEMPGAAERLRLVRADLTELRPFEGRLDGVEAVLHTASPFVISVKDPQADLVDPAVKGTVSMLEACAAAPQVRRVVVTSSMAAITDEPDPARDLTEADWNTKSSLTRNPYSFSKAEAERAAWGFMEREKPGFELVAVNPLLTVGPAKTPAINTSNQVLVDLIKGRYPFLMSLSFGIADVRDVAEAHVRAMTAERAHGRYICAGETMTMRQVVAVLRQLGCGRRLPSIGLDNPIGDRIAALASYTQPRDLGTFIRTHLGRGFRFSNAKIKDELGMTFRPARDTLADTVADLASWHHIPEPAPAPAPH